MAKQKVKIPHKNNTINITVNADKLQGPAELWRYGLGQGGLSDDPRMIEDHISPLKNLNLKYIRLFIQEYYDLYPKHNVYNWKKLDAAVDAILKTGAKPLMSICIKPKVLYPVIDHAKVHPASYGEWEELIYRMVSHYNVERKDGIVYWEIFNEPDIGESGGCPGLFTPADYCIYYEHTVRAILRADPSVKTGGPALAGWESPIGPSWLAYCHKNKLPVDFISWHFYSDDPGTPARGAAYFQNLLKKYHSLKPELVIDEWNIDLQWKRKEPEFQPCFIPEVINNMIKAGIDYSNYYQIRDYHVSLETFGQFFSETGLKFMVNWWNEKLQRDGLFDFQGIMRPAYFVFKMLGKMTGNFIQVVYNSGAVKILATCDPKREVTHILIWNFEDKTPPKRKVKLVLRNMKNNRWDYIRYSLNVKTLSNMENDRMVIMKEIKGQMSCMEDDFNILPYGIHFVVVHPY